MKLLLAGIVILWAFFVAAFFLLGLVQLVAEIPHMLKSLFVKATSRFRSVDKETPSAIS